MSSIFFRTAIIFILLSISMKMMGKREIGELEVGELITTLIISEICSIPIDDPDIPLMNAVIPVLFIVSCEIIISFLKNKSRKLKRVVDGNSAFLIKNRKIVQSSLSDNRISIEEFFAALRQNGIGKVSDVENCILEANGKISVLKTNSGLSTIVISDGEVIDEALRQRGLDEKWLLKQLSGRSKESVFLMTIDDDGSYNIIMKEEKQ